MKEWIVSTLASIRNIAKTEGLSALAEELEIVLLVAVNEIEPEAAQAHSKDELDKTSAQMTQHYVGRSTVH